MGEAALACPLCGRLPDDARRRETEPSAKRDYRDAWGVLRCGECQVPYVGAMKGEGDE